MGLSLLARTATVTNTAGTSTGLTTGAFSPPQIGCMLLALWSGNSLDTANPAAPTITDNVALTHPAWSLNDWASHADAATAWGQAADWRNFAAIGTSQTVTVNNNAASPNRHAALTICQIGGADYVTPVGVHGKAGTTNASTASITYTPTRDGSLLFVAATDWAVAGTMSNNTGLTVLDAGIINVTDLSWGFFVQTTPGVRGQSTTVTFNFGGTSTNANWAWVEVLPEFAYPKRLGQPRPPRMHPSRRVNGRPQVRALPASYVGSAAAPTASAPAETATASGQAFDATVDIQVNAEQPTAVGTAYDAPPPSILPDSSGSTAILAGTTSAVVDITAAAVGAVCYAWAALGANSGTVSATGWTDPSNVINADEGTVAHYAILRRIKQSGDTTFTFSWSASAKGVIAWQSYTGVDPVTPDEQAALATNGVTSRTAVPTPSATPTAANRVPVAFFAVRTSTVGNKPITWTPDAATTERVDVDNNASGSAPWMGVEIADTATAVSQAAHSYTATHNASEGHDGSAILYLIPSSGTSAPAGVATATGVAADAAVDVQVNAESPTGTGAAADAQGAAGVNAQQPTGAGQAFDTAVDSSATPATATAAATALDAATDISFTAQAATAAGSAPDAQGGVGGQAQTASATGAAADASSALATSAETATASGVAADGTGSVGAQPTTAAASGQAFDATVAITVNAETASAAGAAFDAAVNTSGSTNATAETATAAGAASDASAAVTVAAGAATAAGAAADGQGAVGAAAGAASAAGAAQDVTATLATTAGTAQATGSASGVTGDVTTTPGTAQATGQAFDATVGIYAVETAYATGQAFDATVLIVQGDVAPVVPDVVVVTGAVVATVVSPGGPLPVVPGHHARVATSPASGPAPLRVVGDGVLTAASVR